MRCGCRQATRTTRRSSWCAVTPGLTPSGRVELAIYVVEEGWPLRRASRPAVSGLDAHRGALGPALPTAGPVAAGDRGNARPVFAGRGAAPADPPANGPPDRALHAPAAGNRPESSPISACAPSRSIGRCEGLPPLAQLDLVTRVSCGARSGATNATRRPSGARRYQESRQDPERRRAPDSRRQQGKRSRQATAPEARGYGYLHTALDDHSRAGLHTEILADEQGATASGGARLIWFASVGVIVESLGGQPLRERVVVVRSSRPPPGRAAARRARSTGVADSGSPRK